MIYRAHQSGYKDPKVFAASGERAEKEGHHDIAADAFELAAKYERRTGEKLKYLDSAIRNAKAANLPAMADKLDKERKDIELSLLERMFKFDSKSLPMDQQRFEKKVEAAKELGSDFKHGEAFKAYKELAELAKEDPALSLSLSIEAVKQKREQAVVEKEAGIYDLAIAFYKDAIDYAASVGLNNETIPLRRELVLTYHALGRQHERRGKYDEALEAFSDAVRQTTFPGVLDQGISTLLTNAFQKMGSIFEFRKEFGKAQTAYTKGAFFCRESGQSSRESEFLFLLEELQKR